MTQEEKIKALGKYREIDTKDSFGKYLLLNDILNFMGASEADKFMADTLMMLDDEINEMYEETK